MAKQFQQWCCVWIRITYARHNFSTSTRDSVIWPANSHSLGVRLTQSPQRKNENAWEMRAIFAPTSTILYILSLLHQLPQNQISSSPTLGLADLNAWDFCPNFHNFIYTIIETSTAPKPNLKHCPTLGLAGLSVIKFNEQLYSIS